MLRDVSRQTQDVKLAHLTWPEVEAIDRDCVVLIPTGSLEQHGAHLPLFTDSLIVTAVAEAAEAQLSEQVLLTPTLWLGASAHHLGFAGSLSASFETYEGAIQEVVEALVAHGFRKFVVVNGHGGNTSPNDVATRRLKAKHPHLSVGHVGYFAFCEEVIAEVLEGPAKTMRHACEGETSLMMHLHPNLVRADRRRDDGLAPNPPVKSLIHFFDEITEQGSLGYATLAMAEKGARIFDAAVTGLVGELRTIAQGYVLEGLPPKE